MKMIPKHIAVAMMVAAAAILPAHAFAAERDPASGAPADAHAMDRHDKGAFFEDLNLTPRQREQVKAHREEGKEKMKAVREQLRARHAELRSEMAKETVDRAKIQAIAANLKGLEGQIVDLRIASILSLKEILTPEQFRKMNAKMDAHKGARGPKRGPKRGPGEKGGEMPPPPAGE